MTTIRSLIAAALVAGSSTLAFADGGVSTYNIGSQLVEGRNSAEFVLPPGEKNNGIHEFNATAGRVIVEGRNSATVQAPASEVNVQR
jgi:hypothetical protein